MAKSNKKQLIGKVETKPTELELSLVKKLIQKKIGPKELDNTLKSLKGVNPHKYLPVEIDFYERRLRFGLFSDLHLGHMCYRPDALRKLSVDGKRQGVEFWINAGDTIEGIKSRPGHIHELDFISVDQQLDFFAQEFRRFRKTIYSIEPERLNSRISRLLKSPSFHIGEELEKKSKHYKFIGYDEQNIVLKNGLVLTISHPNGVAAYGQSYKTQKYVESLSGGQKPHLLCQGHFCKVTYLFYRDIYCFDSGTLCNQTPVMKKKKTPAHVGYWIIDVTMHKNKKRGVELLESQFIPFYE